MRRRDDPREDVCPYCEMPYAACTCESNIEALPQAGPDVPCPRYDSYPNECALAYIEERAEEEGNSGDTRSAGEGKDSI